MNNSYIIEKNVDKIKRYGYTDFLNQSMVKDISYRLKKDEYKIYSPYKDSDKVILYTDIIPKICLLEITCYYQLKHSEILGSLFGLNITDEVFGDIVIIGDKYYVYVVDKIKDFILNNLIMVGNKSVKIKEVNLNLLDNYERKYEECEYIVSSLRLDTVVSRIVGSSRDRVKNYFKNKLVIVNYNVVTNGDYTLKELDVFSIKRYGKYKYMGIVKTTKKDNYIIKILRYL